MDQWQQHVSLEISDAVGDDERVLEILYALTLMNASDLIPESIADQLFNQISITTNGGQ
jgi:hypothetical protein